MKIDKYEKIAKSKYRLYLSNGEIIDTYDEVILKNELLLKQELSIQDYQNILSQTTIVENYNACLKYITIRLRSTKEIKDYLKRKKIEKDVIEEIIKRLEKDNLLNDEHFTECFIKDKINFTTMGQYRINNELKKHEISNSIIDKYSYLYDYNTMYSKIEKLTDKQINQNKKLDKYKLRNKIYNYLLNQGYATDMIITILNKKF